LVWSPLIFTAPVETASSSLVSCGMMWFGVSLGQSYGRIGVVRLHVRGVVQDSVLHLDKVIAISAKIEVELGARVAGLFAVQADREIIEEQIQGHRAHCIGAGGIWRRQFRYAVAQFLGTGQIKVAPRSVLGLIAELLECVGL
jgi:hypothetical protein